MDIQSISVQGSPTQVSKVYFDFVQRFWSDKQEGDHQRQVGEAAYKRALRAQFPVTEFTETKLGEDTIQFHMLAGDGGRFRSTITFSPQPELEGTRIAWESEFNGNVPTTGQLLKHLMAEKVFMPIIQHFSNLNQSKL
ncbi:hypothetical protein BASA81_006567 [Batrachochytrium salamandrivorans]|nr:hypothetical protein BASA81_006567 [Batrachochytrium salamandrivorans]